MSSSEDIPSGPVPAEENGREIIEVSDAEFDRLVLQSALPVVVDFWAAWCGPCRNADPVIEEAARKYEGKIKFCKVDVDENPRSTEIFRVLDIPLLLFFKDGKVVGQSPGVLPFAQLRPGLEALL